MRRPPLFVLLTAFMLALALGGYLWRMADRVPRLGSVEGSGTATIGTPFNLIDQDGHSRHAGDFAGRYMLIYFGYTHCPDICPMTLSLMAEALAKLGPDAERIAPIFITFDPERDPPAVLKQYLAQVAPGFTGLTGTPAAVKQAMSGYNVYVHKEPLSGGTYGFKHSSVIYLMDPRGKFVTYWDDTAIGPDGLARAIRDRL
jgi:protein SCO1/2